MERQFQSENNRLDCPTGQSRDVENVGEFSSLSNPPDPAEMKNPDALAGAVGADQNETPEQEGLETGAYPKRGLRAIALFQAIWAAHPHDAADIMTEELLRLSAGTPPHDVFGLVREDARWWASVASPAELVEYMVAAMRAVLNGRSALCLEHRKRLMAEIWRSLPEADRHSFLRRADPTGAFRKGGAQ